MKIKHAQILAKWSEGERERWMQGNGEEERERKRGSKYRRFSRFFCRKRKQNRDQTYKFQLSKF